MGGSGLIGRYIFVRRKKDKEKEEQSLKCFLKGEEGKKESEPYDETSKNWLLGGQRDFKTD